MLPLNLTVLPRNAFMMVLIAGLMCGCAPDGNGVAASGSNQIVSGGSNAGSADPATGDFSLAWVAPSIRADGAPISLADIAGYRVYYGTTAGTYPNSIDIVDGGSTSAVISSVPVGTYHVVMTTIDINGIESAYSPGITKVVN